MKDSKKNKLIIFDLDGTLYNLKGGVFKDSKLNEKMLENAEKFIQSKLKKTPQQAKKILKDIQKKYGENISIAMEKEFNIDRYEYFNKVWDINPKNLMIRHDGLEDILLRLSKEYQFLLTSDAPKIWIDNVLEELNIKTFFEGKILSGEGDKRKVFGNRFVDISKEYNIDPSRIVVMGDQEKSDIIPAKELGFNTIYINNMNESDIADINIADTKYLEAAFSFLFSDVRHNEYYKYALKVLNITNPYKAKILSGSSDAIVFKYEDLIYKVGPTSQTDKEINIFSVFKKQLGDVYGDIFPDFKIVNSQEGKTIYQLQNVGEYNLEDYLLSPKINNNIKEAKKICGQVLQHIDTIYEITHIIDEEKKELFFKNLLIAIEDNLKRANLWDDSNKTFLQKLQANKELFVQNMEMSLFHKDLTAGNIMINKKTNAVFFIDPRIAMPYSNELFYYGSVSVDLAGYFVSIVRKELEHNRLFQNSSLEEVKKIIEDKIEQYISKDIFNKHILDLSIMFWYSVYLSCKCKYCTSPKRKWLYDEMNTQFYIYRQKIEKFFDNV